MDNNIRTVIMIFKGKVASPSIPPRPKLPVLVLCCERQDLFLTSQNVIMNWVQHPEWVPQGDYCRYIKAVSTPYLGANLKPSTYYCRGDGPKL